MNCLYKFVLTLNATSWMTVIYGISKQWTIIELPCWITGIILLLIPILLSLISLIVAKGLGNDSLSGCRESSLADNEFIPTYLGYFFVSLSVADNVTIAQMKSYYAVFRDSSMANDSVATNFEQIFETYSPDTVRKVL